LRRSSYSQNNALEACFSLIGVDASIANAFRRILIAEVPSLAINVYIHDNTSVIHDDSIWMQEQPFSPLHIGGGVWLSSFGAPTRSQAHDLEQSPHTLS
jgi:DNA-directed RNA polymerase I and III subunit RPAC1